MVDCICESQRDPPKNSCVRVLRSRATTRITQICSMYLRRPNMHDSCPGPRIERPWCWTAASYRERPRTMPRRKVDAVDKRTFHVHYRLDDDGSWFVKSTDLQGAHTSGRSIVTARANIREAVALVLDDDDPFELTESFDLPDLDALTTAQQLRAEAQQLTETADLALKSYVAKSELSVRDLGALFGLSFQRIQQLRSG
jgi:predicted RNase H-like HicB family nuclease